MTNTKAMGRKGGLVGWRIAAWTGAGLILLLPLIAMRFTDEVQWTGSDFVFAGVMLAFLVGAFELVVRLNGNWSYRGGVVVAALATFLMVWIQGAVGLVGNENDAVNLLFFLPLLVGAAGLFIADFKARGLARVFAAMALLQATTMAIGFWITGDTDAVLLSFWAFAWSVCAWLFGRAARGQPELRS